MLDDWHWPFNFPPGFSLVGTLAWYESDSNIQLYDSQVTYAGLSMLYRFECQPSPTRN